MRVEQLLAIRETPRCVLGGRRDGFLEVTANGSRLNGADIDSADFPLVVNGAARTWLSDLLITPEATTAYTALFSGAAPSIKGFYSDDEGSSGRNFVATMAFEYNWAPAEIAGFEIDTVAGGSGRGHGVIFDNGYAGTVHDGSFSDNSNEAAIFVNGNGSGMHSHPVAYSILRASHPIIGMTRADAGMTLSKCGTASLSPNPQDLDFEVTVTGTTSCQVNFGISFASSPAVNCEDESHPNPLQVSATTTQARVAGLASGDKFRCSVPIQSGY